MGRKSPGWNNSGEYYLEEQILINSLYSDLLTLPSGTMSVAAAMSRARMASWNHGEGLVGH